jgi:DNA-binding NarL/FixJ family response regulator
MEPLKLHVTPELAGTEGGRRPTGVPANGSPKPDPEVAPRATRRETDVLRLIAQGKNTKEISSALHISVKTVDTHRQNIMNKLNIHNTVDLVKYAIRTGLVSL